MEGDPVPEFRGGHPLEFQEIATLTGFVDASHLSKHFVAQVGVAPIKFRKIYSKSKTKFNRTNKSSSQARFTRTKFSSVSKFMSEW